jgi:hypothetical protein
MRRTDDDIERNITSSDVEFLLEGTGDNLEKNSNAATTRKVKDKPESRSSGEKLPDFGEASFVLNEHVTR